MKFKLSDTVLFVIFIALLVYILCVQRMKLIKGGDRETSELAEILNKIGEILYNMPKLPVIMDEHLPPKLQLRVAAPESREGSKIMFNEQLLENARGGDEMAGREVIRFFGYMDVLLKDDSSLIKQMDTRIRDLSTTSGTYKPPPVQGADDPLPIDGRPATVPAEPKPVVQRNIVHPNSAEFNTSILNLNEIRVWQKQAEDNIKKHRSGGPNPNPFLVAQSRRRLAEVNSFVEWSQYVRTLEYYWKVTREYGDFLDILSTRQDLMQLQNDILGNNQLNVSHYRGILNRFNTIYRGMGMGPPGDGDLIPKLRELEASLLARKGETDKLRADLERRDDELKARQQEIGKLKGDLASQNIELAELKARLRESQDIVAATNRELITKNTEIQELEKRLRELENRSNTKEEELEGMLDIERKAAARLKIQIDALNKSIEDSAGDTGNLRQRIADIEQKLKRSEDDVNLLKKEIARLENALREAAEQEQELNRIIEEQRQTIENKEREIKELREQLFNLAKELEDSRRENAELKLRMEEGDRRLADELAGKDLRIAELEERLGDCLRRLAERDANIAELRAEIERLRAEIDRLRAAAAAPPPGPPVPAIGADEILQLVTTLRQQPKDITVNVNTPAPIYVDDEPLKINDRVTRHLKKQYR